MAREDMRSTDCLVVTTEPVAQLLPFFMGATLSLFYLSNVSLGWSKKEKESFLARFLLPTVFYVRTQPSRGPCNLMWSNICIVHIKSLYLPLFLMRPFSNKVSMSLQTLEGICSMLQQPLGVAPVSTTMSNAFPLSIVCLHFCLLWLRVFCCLMKVRLAQHLLSRSLLLILPVLIKRV